jgi:hypothetical protein
VIDMTDDLMDTLARYAPSKDALAEQAGPVRAEVLARTVRPGSAGARVFPLQDALTAPPRHRRSLALIAACAVILLVAGVVGGIKLLSERHGGQPAGGGPTTSADVVGPDQFAYSVKDDYVYRAGTRPVLSDRVESWVAPDGAVWTRTTDLDGATCSRTDAPRRGNVLAPSTAFFDALPTNPDQLNQALRQAVTTPRVDLHLAAAPSIDGMVFDSASVMFDPADLLAPPTLRAALFRVLERTPGVTVQRDVHDFGVRGATRLDQEGRTGRTRFIKSTWFDPDTDRLLGGRTQATGPHPRTETTMALITTQRVVDSVPISTGAC